MVLTCFGLNIKTAQSHFFVDVLYCFWVDVGCEGYVDFENILLLEYRFITNIVY